MANLRHQVLVTRVRLAQRQINVKSTVPLDPSRRQRDLSMPRRTHASCLPCLLSRVSSTVESESDTCSNGLVGVEGSGMCCPLECGTCGDSEDCSSLGDDCCAKSIADGGVYCDYTWTAPCIINTRKISCSYPQKGMIRLT